jgi:3D (Asp-Asp-Asp) domain-containing protein
MAKIPKLKSQQWWTAAAIFCGMLTIPYYWVYGKVNIRIDGKVLSAVTLDRSVANILQQSKVSYGPQDIILPDINQRLRPGEDIRIIRVMEKFIETTDDLPYTITSQERSQSNLRLVEIQRGYFAKRVRQIKIRYHDQAEFSREVTREKLDKSPVYKLILKNNQGQPVREYDLSKARSILMTATSYYPYDPLCFPGGDGIHTCLGLVLRRGFVAVDPRVIPLRTRLYIPGYGYAYAADTGSAIKGKRIDLAVGTKAECDRFGKRRLKVYVLDKAQNW